MDKKVYINFGEDSASLLQGLFNHVPWIKGLFSPKEHVLLKPNVLLDKKSETGATTDPVLVEQLILELRGYGVSDITIAEGAWLGADTQKAFEVCGFAKLAEKYNVGLVDLKVDKYESIPVKLKNSQLKRVKIAQTVLAATKMINLPVLKAHCQTKLTCGMKNLMGVISDSEKRRFHRLSLDQAIFELNAAYSPTLNICDAIIGDLTFEEGGTPVKFGRVFMSSDITAFDSYAATCLGYEPFEIGYLDLNRSKNGFTKHEVECLTAPAKKMDFKAIDYQSRYQSKINPYNVCCSCLASVFTALEATGYDSSEFNFFLGSKLKPDDIDPSKLNIIIGDCNQRYKEQGNFVKGCPASGEDVSKILKKIKSK